jgi:ABC-type transport system involved in cytochrome c biogenesis permease subunit
LASGKAGAILPLAPEPFRKPQPMLHRFANPARFQRLARRLMPWLAAACILLFPLGLVLAFLAPPDYQQGLSVRIMYVHVPAAWMALSVYALVALASAVALIWRHPLADLVAKSASPVGAAFTFLALATGSLWGKPMWGTWWEWDARMTSMLILFFLISDTSCCSAPSTTWCAASARRRSWRWSAWSICRSSNSR